MLVVLMILAAPAGPGTAAGPVEDTWRRLLVASGPAAGEEPPHPEALHEWWFVTVQNAAGETGCGPWQAMVSAVADREAIHDQLLFTTVVEGVASNHSQEFLLGAMRRSRDAVGRTVVTIGRSRIVGTHPRWRVRASARGATLDLHLDASGVTLWHRRAPEGWGVLEITYAIRAAASGTLRVGGRTCEVTGTGYVEHVWGTWSRIPMWGVDYLNAHLEGGWSAYARRTPMRGESSLYPRLGLDPEDLYPPVLVLRDPGGRMHEASGVAFTLTESTEIHPDLGVPLPASYAVTGTIAAPGGPRRVTLAVADPVLATIFFETTSSGVLEGWAPATLTLEGAAPLAGTAEVEFQRFGTTFPR
jgi:hypothetical protein